MLVLQRIRAVVLMFSIPLAIVSTAASQAWAGGNVQQTQTQLGIAVARDQALNAQIAAINHQLAQVAQDQQRATARLQALTSQVRAVEAELDGKETALRSQVSVVGAETRQMYKSGGVDPMAMVLSASNFNDFLNRLFFFNDIARQNRRRADALRESRDAVQVLRETIKSNQAQQAATVRALKRQQATLQADRANAVELQRQVALLEAQLRGQLAEMQAQRVAFRSQLQQVFRDSSGVTSTGRFIWPLTGVITQGFGCTTYYFEPYDPNCATRHFHSGVDIAADLGSAVRAADSGIVHNLTQPCGYSGGLCGYGRYVVIVHANGFATLYGHLAGWAVPDGTRVGQGAVIGYEGSTGNSTGPHLHFEIDANGSPVNPFAYLP
jgi:murein DD-endopeptidase MepM/ murein hydrolase activator NlpD